MYLEDLCECEEDEKPGNDISNKSYRYAAHRIYTKQSGSGDEDDRLCETCTSYRVVLFSPFERDIQIRTTHILYFIIHGGRLWNICPQSGLNRLHSAGHNSIVVKVPVDAASLIIWTITRDVYSFMLCGSFLVWCCEVY